MHTAEKFVVGLMVVTTSLHLFMFSHNSREGSGSSCVGDIGYSNNSYDDGSFTKKVAATAAAATLADKTAALIAVVSVAMPKMMAAISAAILADFVLAR